MYVDVDTAITVPVNVFPLTDDTDFKSREVSVAYDQAGMDLVWNFQTTAGVTSQTAVTPTTAGVYDWTHSGDGMYKIEIPASGGGSINNDAEGFGWFSGFATGVLPWRGPIISFRAAGLNNALIDSAYSATRGLAGTALPDAVSDAAGGLVISDAGEQDFDAMNAAAIRLTAVRAAVLTDWINGNRLDLLLDAIPTTAMRGTDSAYTGTPPTVAQIQAEMEENGASLLDTIRDQIGTAGDGLTDITINAASVALFWNEVIGKASYNVGQSAAKILRQSGDLIQIAGAVSDASPTTTDFDTDLTQVDTYFNDAVMVFVNGAANMGIGKHVSASLNANGNVTFTAEMAWPVTPVNGDDFVIVALHTHPISEIQSGLATEAKQDIIDGNVDTLITQVGTAGDGLTDLGGMSTGMKGEVNTEVDGALNTAIPGSPTADSINERIATLNDEWDNGGRLDVIQDSILADTVSMGITKNATFGNFEFLMVDATDFATPETGLTVTGQRSIDGGAFANVSGTIAEVGSGIYQIDLLAADTNGDLITYKFASVGAADRFVTVQTRA